jgi:toxin ParE1/3/4
MASYKLTTESVKDLEHIWKYTFENFSVEQADRYYHLIIDEIEYIAKYPNVGTSIDHIRAGYRTAKVKSHLIFYRFSAEKVIEIIRILHQSMEVESRI